VKHVLARVWLRVAAGVLIGVAVSFWASTFIASLLYGLEPRDPVTILAAIMVLVVVGTLAGYIPAWRASRIDPAAVLRES
jgi:putative ABC transport system permease protein